MPFFFKKNIERGWLVIDMQSDRVRLAHVLPGNGAARVLFCEERHCSAQEPKELEKIAREFHAERYQCTTLLGPSDYQILLVEAPTVKPDELKAAVRWRIKDMIDYHVDDAVVDVLDIPPAEGAGPRGHMMYAISARNETVRKLIDRFETARIPLQVIDIPDTAQRNLAARLESKDKGLVMASFNEHGGHLTFTFQGELYLTRRIDITAQSLSDPDEAKRAQALERAALEVQRSLDHFERQYHYIGLERVVIAPSAGAAALVERIASITELPVQLLALDSLIDISAAPVLDAPEGQSRWLMSIGAGLRVETRAL